MLVKIQSWHTGGEMREVLPAVFLSGMPSCSSLTKMSSGDKKVERVKRQGRKEDEELIQFDEVAGIPSFYRQEAEARRVT